MATDRRSPLELMLPAARATRAVLLGSACPSRLRPVAAADAAGAEADLVVVAPSPAEAARAGWLEAALATCGERLAADGLAYVIASRNTSARVRPLLAAAGLEVETTMAHLPGGDDPRHLVPLQPRALRDALTHALSMAPWKRAALGAVLQAGGWRALSARNRGTGLAARRPGARPLFDWLPPPAHREGGGAVTISSSWRAPGAAFVLRIAPAGAEAAPIVKVSPRAGRPGADEASRLRGPGAAARRAGARVPEPLAERDLDGYRALVETRLSGELLAPRLIRNRASLDPTLELVCGWLEEWQRETATVRTLDRELLERELLAPAAGVLPRLDGGAELLTTLERECARLEGTHAPLTAAHNDVTMWNLLVDRRHGLGVLDWEAAAQLSLPLKDLPYAVVDAVAAVGGYTDRLEAVRECFEPGGARFPAVAKRTEAAMRAVGATPDLVDLAFAACWLGHAANESAEVAAGDPAPFRDIAAWLARRGHRGARVS